MVIYIINLLFTYLTLLFFDYNYQLIIYSSNTILISIAPYQYYTLNIIYCIISLYMYILLCNYLYINFFNDYNLILFGEKSPFWIGL